MEPTRHPDHRTRQAHRDLSYGVQCVAGKQQCVCLEVGGTSDFVQSQMCCEFIPNVGDVQRVSSGDGENYHQRGCPERPWVLRGRLDKSKCKHQRVTLCHQGVLDHLAGAAVQRTVLSRLCYSPCKTVQTAEFYHTSTTNDTQSLLRRDGAAQRTPGRALEGTQNKTGWTRGNSFTAATHRSAPPTADENPKATAVSDQSVRFGKCS